MLVKQFRSLLNKQTTNLGIYGIGQAFNLITPLLVVPYIVGVCGEEGYGKTGVGMALSFFLMVFIDYGSDIEGVKQVAVLRNEPQRLAEIFATTYCAKAILFLVVAACAVLMFVSIPYFRNEKELFLLGLPILLGQCINPTWFLQGIESFKWITILTIISKSIYVLGVFFVIRNPADYIYNNMIWGAGMIVAHGIAVAYLVLRFRISFLQVRRGDVKAIVRNNFSIFSSQIFVSLQMYSPIMLIGFFGGNFMAGQYKIIDQVIVIFKTYILLFFNYVFPRVCYLLETNLRAALLFWKRYNGVNFVFVAVSMGVLFVFSAEVVSYFNPRGINEITDLLKIAVAIPLLQAVTIPLKQLVLGWNKQKEYVRYTMGMTVSSLLMIIAATPFLHVKGVLFALILTEIVTGVLFYKAVKSNFFLRG